MENYLINSLSAAIYWVDNKGIYQGCNLTQAKIFGLTRPEDIIGMLSADLPLFKNNRDAAHQLDKTHLQSINEKNQKISKELVLHNSKKRIYIVLKSPVLNKTGAIERLVVMSIDITDIDMSDKVALEDIFNSLPGHVYWKNLEGYFLGCNLLQAKSAGFSSPEEMIGKTDYDMPWKEQANLYRANDLQVMKTGIPILTEEIGILEGSQEVHTFLVNKIPLRNKGEIIGILGISLDMTTQKKIQDGLKNENINHKIALENILNNLPGHVYWKNLTGYYLGCNIQQARTCGFNAPEEMIGNTDYDMPWKEQADFYRENDLQVMETGIPVLTEEEGTLENGEVHTFLANKIPLRDTDKKIIGILGISLDINEQKKMQAALKKAEGQIEGMTLVSAAVAHELRTPLATIMMGMQGIEKYLNTLLETYQLAQENQLQVKPIPSETLNKLANAISNIKSECTHANMMINMLLVNLSFQKHQQLKKESSIAKCIQDALNQYIFQGDIRSLLHVDLRQDFTFSGDAILLLHILFNFLKNSLYFIKKVRKGEIFISLNLGDEYNELHFKDTAQGIQPEDLSKIFDQFYTKDTHHGTGIGLAFCKAVMESWDGKIACHSKYGEYVEFICYFNK
jgi:two-component system, OmpR family, aerobic respiration control sensor histidine kinase ArcB